MTQSQLFKYGSLLFLTLQTTCLVLTMRISRSQKLENQPVYLISTIVVCAEVAKLFTCIVALIIQERGRVLEALRKIYEQVFVDYRDTLLVLIPAILYTIQNGLLYVAISNLNAVAYQILYQFKIFTTALFMVIILKRKLLSTQWMALVLLCLGIVLSQLKISSDDTTTAPASELSSSVIGLLAVGSATLSSGFAGVYYEKILKGTAPSVWLRNIQLALFGIIVGCCGVFLYDGKAVMRDGFFQGYSTIVWLIIFLQTLGGLGIAFVIKYADNLLKGFAAGLSILVSSLVSYLILGDFNPTLFTFLGATMVISATVLYGYQPKENVPSTTEKV